MSDVWECGVCGRDNPERQTVCILCESPRGGESDGEAAAEREAALAAEMIQAAEAEFSRQMGVAISLKILGRPQPATVAEAEALIRETRLQIQEQQTEQEER
ncbi:MAG: hypothetical protein K0Q72_4512 [Armatimonadetes bacterium]|jgi:hypothetical protein|nr:hypothetical protein [Armatimonadota bacterium]